MIKWLKYVLLVLLFSQTYVAYAYNYDVNTAFKQFSETTFEGDFSGYDDTSNLCYNGRYCTYTNLQKKTRNGSFFAFDVGLVATKKGGKEYGSYTNTHVRILIHMKVAKNITVKEIESVHKSQDVKGQLKIMTPILQLTGLPLQIDERR